MVTGLASLNQIAGDLKGRNHPGIAPQSLHQRFDIRCTALLVAVSCNNVTTPQPRHSRVAESNALSLRMFLNVSLLVAFYRAR